MLKNELMRSLEREIYDSTPEGVFFPREGVLVRGEYIHRVNGGPWETDKNLVVAEGLAFLLNTALGSAPKAAGFFIALFNGAAQPAAAWTAASFAAAAGEIVSQSEGYTSPTRPAWTPVNAAANAIDNYAAAASFTIATASSLTVTGAALLTSATRGGTTGTLVSAAKYAAERVFQSGDTYDVGYRLSLTT